MQSEDVKKMSDTIEIKLARIGDEVRTFLFTRGTTVKAVVERADIDGDAHSVMLNGAKVSDDYVLNESGTLIVVPEVEAGD